MDLKLIVVGSSSWARAVAKANPAMPVVIVTTAAMVKERICQ